MNDISRLVPWTVAAALALGAGLAVADTLELRDGRSVHGTLTGATRDSVHFRIEGVVRHFPLSQVERIAFDARAAESAGASSAPTSPATSGPVRTVLVPADGGLGAGRIEYQLVEGR